MDYIKVINLILENPANTLTNVSRDLLETMRVSLSIEHKKFIDGDEITNGQFIATVLNESQLENKTYVMYNHNGQSEYVDTSNWRLIKK